MTDFQFNAFINFSDYPLSIKDNSIIQFINDHRYCCAVYIAKYFDGDELIYNEKWIQYYKVSLDKNGVFTDVVRPSNDYVLKIYDEKIAMLFKLTFM